MMIVSKSSGAKMLAPSSMAIASLPKIAPASMSSNDGLASFSSSVIAKNCPGAKASWTVLTSCVTPSILASSLKRRAPAIGAPPNVSRSREVLSGTICCFTTRLPSGSSTSVVPGAILRSDTPCCRFCASCVLQASGAVNARRSSANASTAGGNGGFSPEMSVLSKRIVKSHQKISNDALPLMRSGRGPSSVPATDSLKRLREPRLSCTEALKSAIRWNGSRWISTSKPMSPSMLNPNAAAYSSARAPNWIVLDVIAK